MERLDRVISAFGFNIVETINDKQTLFVNKAAVSFDVRGMKEFDVYANSGYGRYIKVGRLVSRIVRDETNRFIPCLEAFVDKPERVNTLYWWQKD